MSRRKIFLDPASLKPHIDELRSAGSTIATACGCFELIHVGHVRYLYGAKNEADVLIVAVNTDASMRLIKPDRRPVNPDHERFEILAALEPVDYVVPLVDARPDRLIEMFRPDVHCKGKDYTLETLLPLWSTTNEQDWTICENQQAGVSSSRYRPGPYSKLREPNVAHFLEWYLRETAGWTPASRAAE